MALVNLFVAGHPRSGTGTIDGWLNAHPDIFMGPKELHYFGSDLDFNVPNRSKKNYDEQFRQWENQSVIGESSTWYLASKVAAKEIHGYNPRAKIVLSLRNPVDWLHSLHSHQVFAGYEDIVEFSAALDAETERLQGYRLPSNPNPKIAPYYRSLTNYPAQIKRYRQCFPEENILILIFDDLKNEPAKSADRLFNFLGLNRDFPNRKSILKGNKKQRNANHKHRSRRLQKWIKSPPRRSILHGVIPSPVPGGRLLLRGLHKVNQTDAERRPMTDTLRKKLSEEFKPMIDELEQLIHVDLSGWNFHKRKEMI